jgi:hypothetical protein
MKNRRIALSLIALAALVMASALALKWNSARAGSGPSANGSGQLVINGVKRQFSFSATTKSDGTVNGSAEIHNPNFDFRSHIDVSCLLVDGNRASIGGRVRSTNDPAFDGQNGFFTVIDNGEPGKGKDTISLVFFANPPGPEACRFIGPDDFDQTPISAGNIQVRQ